MTQKKQSAPMIRCEMAIIASRNDINDIIKHVRSIGMVVSAIKFAPCPIQDAATIAGVHIYDSESGSC